MPLTYGVVTLQARPSGPSTTDVVLEMTASGEQLHGILQCSCSILSRASSERLLSSLQVRQGSASLRLCTFSFHLAEFERLGQLTPC